MEIIGKSFASTNVVTLGLDGKWKAVVSFIEGRIVRGSDTWEYKNVEAIAFGDTLQEAYATALQDVGKLFIEAMGETNTMFGEIDASEIVGIQTPSS